MKSKKLSEIVEIIMGQSPPSSSYSLQVQGLPFFQGKADFGDIYPKVRVFCNKPQKIALMGDILISVRAPVGPTNINSEKSCIGRGLAALRCGKEIDTHYLLYFLRFHEPELAQLSNGSTFDAISRDDLENTIVPLPSLIEQKRISNILKDADHLWRLRRYAWKLSSTYLQSVFLEMFGDPSKNSQNWSTDYLYQLCSKVVDCPHSTPNYSSTPTDYACVRSSDIQEGVLDWSTTKYVNHQEYQKRIHTHVPVSGEVVYCREGARFGNAAIITNDKKICLGQRMMLFKAAPNVATPEFIWALLESESTRRQADRISSGSASPHLNVGDIKEFIAIIPPLSLQQRYSQIVQKYERLRDQQKEAERQAEHLFQTLLHKAFQGELNLYAKELVVPEMKIVNQQTPLVANIIEPIDTDTYQLTLLLE